MSVREVFDRSAREYDAARRRLVPCFDDFYGTALEAIPFAPDEPISVLDLGAGTGLLSLFVADRYAKASLHLIDVSPEMLAVARERFAGAPQHFEFELRDFADGLASRSYDCVVSALAIHHLPAAGKRELFHTILEGLAPGGVFVNADQIVGASPAETERNHEQWMREARSLGSDDEELARARERMQEDQPSSVEAQLEWLREAGFAEVACPFRHGMFAVFAARRGRGAG